MKPHTPISEENMKIKEVFPAYIKHLKARGRAYYTTRKIHYGLNTFILFLQEENVTQIEDLSSEIMEDYQQDLAFRLTAKGRLLSLRTQESLLCTAKGFTRYLKEKDYLVSDPGERIKPPKMPKRLPRVILDQTEIRRLRKAPDMRTNLGYRDRVILEILYDTAIRRLELKNIKLTDLDLDTGFILIRHGKGDKDRVVPVSQKVCELIKNYILFVRPSLITGKDEGYLIVNYLGHQMDPLSIWRCVKHCAGLAGIKKNVSPHTFRHTCATHMLKNGAPIRHLQEMLGHASLESTQVYTRVTINDLKEIHSKYHPSEKMIE
jgi:integrase/recombinase XerD